MIWVSFGSLLQIALICAVCAALVTQQPFVWSEVIALTAAVGVLYPMGDFRHDGFPGEPTYTDDIRLSVVCCTGLLMLIAPLASLWGRKSSSDRPSRSSASRLRRVRLDIGMGILLTPVAAIAGLLGMGITCPAALLALVFPFMPPAIWFAAFGFVVMLPLFKVLFGPDRMSKEPFPMLFATSTSSILLYVFNRQNEPSPAGVNPQSSPLLDHWLMFSFWLGTTVGAWWTARLHDRMTRALIVKQADRDVG